MPTTIYDSSLITQRRRDKTVSGSFINRIQNPTNPNTGSAPMLGISQQSIINTVKNGQMKDYRKNDTGCTTISSGCPCSINAFTEPALLPPGIVPNIQYSYGSIIATWDVPTSGGPASSYNVNLIPSPGLSFVVYQNYFNDNVNFFAAATPISGTSSGNTNDLSTLITSTPSVTLPADNFSVQWLGYFYATESGIYTFKTISDDASYVWVGSNATSGFTTSNATVNNGGQHPNISAEGTINLTVGTFYPIRIQYGEAIGGQNFTLKFSLPSAPSAFISSGSYFFQGLPFSSTTSLTTYTFPNNLLTATATYYLSVNAENNAGQGPVGFYLSGGNPGLITGLYNPPNMSVISTTSNTCTISYSFSTLPGIGFAIPALPTVGVVGVPALPAGWTVTSQSNTQFVLTKTAPNPASLPITQKFYLQGANPGEITYPSNPISGIQTTGYIPSISQTGGSATTAILTVAAYTGFTITGASVDPTTPLPPQWSLTSFTGGNTITLTWNGTTPSQITQGIKFILTNGTVNSPSSNAVSGINVQIVPVPSFLPSTPLFVGGNGSESLVAYSFTTPSTVSDVYLYGGGNSYNTEEAFAIYGTLFGYNDPHFPANNISNTYTFTYDTTNGTTITNFDPGKLNILAGTSYNTNANYINPVILNTPPSTSNYNIKMASLPANTTFYLIAASNYNDIGPFSDRSVALASFDPVTNTYMGQLTLNEVTNKTVYGFNLGGGTCTDGDIVPLTTYNYPVTLYENVPIWYPNNTSGAYRLVLQPSGLIQIIDGSPKVTFTYQTSPTPQYLCTADVYNNPPGRDIINKAYFYATPTSLTATNLFPASLPAGELFTFTSPAQISDIYVYVQRTAIGSTQNFGFYTNSVGTSTLGTPTINAGTITQNPAGATLSNNCFSVTTPPYTNSVLINTQPTVSNYDIKISNVPANTTYFIKTEGSGVGINGTQIAIAAFVTSSSDFIQQPTIYQTSISTIGASPQIWFIGQNLNTTLNKLPNVTGNTAFDAPLVSGGQALLNSGGVLLNGSTQYATDIGWNTTNGYTIILCGRSFNSTTPSYLLNAFQYPNVTSNTDFPVFIINYPVGGSNAIELYGGIINGANRVTLGTNVGTDTFVVALKYNSDTTSPNPLCKAFFNGNLVFTSSASYPQQQNPVYYTRIGGNSVNPAESFTGVIYQVAYYYSSNITDNDIQTVSNQLLQQYS